MKPAISVFIEQLLLFARMGSLDNSTVEGRAKERYRRIILTSITSLATRGFGMLVNLVTVPLILSYLGKDQYGLWATITSFTVWVILFDFGIVNGLVNAISEAHGKNDREMAISSVSTAFFLLVSISIFLVIVSTIVIPLMPWDSIFAVKGLVSIEVAKWSVLTAVLPIIIGMPLSIVRQIYAGYQKAYISNIFYALGSLFMLAGLVLAMRLGASLPTVILVTSSASFIASLFNYCYLIRIQMPWLRPHYSTFSIKVISRLARVSVPLFFFQIGALLVNNTQLLILAHRTNLGTVTEYSILMRLYALVSSFIILTTNSFVPSFREASERGDWTWTRQSFKQMLSLRMTMIFFSSLIMMVAGNWLLEVWLQQQEICFGLEVWAAFSIMGITSTWAMAFADLLIIMDKVWIQVGLVLINGIVTNMLTFLLAPTFEIFGAVVSISIVSITISSWFQPLLACQFLNQSHRVS